MIINYYAYILFYDLVASQLHKTAATAEFNRQFRMEVLFSRSETLLLRFGYK